MSSNLRIKKVCEQCGKVFIAKTTVTKCCSDPCAKKYYKAQKRQTKVEASNEQTKEQLRPVATLVPAISRPDFTEDLINIQTLSAATGISRASLFRLMQDDAFPKLRIGRILLFDKVKVLQYLTEKYGNI
jgi:predicted DNA-binding transcriptional regulator AlpA